MKVCLSAIGAYKALHSLPGTPRNIKVTPPLLIDTMPIGFFDGASQEGGYLFGASMVLKIGDNHILKLSMGCGQGSNTKSELLALYGLLVFVNHLGISHLQVVGDSKVVIEWDQRKNNLQVLFIEWWQASIKDIQESFQVLLFPHAFREFNLDVDFLSKKSLHSA